MSKVRFNEVNSVIVVSVLGRNISIGILVGICKISVFRG